MYETIGEEDKDLNVVRSPRPRMGPLPTPGYAGLMSVQPSAPAVYSQMESYESPVDIVPDSSISRVVATIEHLQGKKPDELETAKSESPLQESLLMPNAPTYLEIIE